MNSSDDKRRQSRTGAAIRGVSALLACVVLFLTLHALTRPAITLEGQTCPIPEHTHTDECYETAEVPAETAHTHTDACYDTEKTLICGLEESATLQKKPICGLQEHIHSEACQSASALSDEDQARVNEAIALIDALPTADEIEAQLTALDDAGDEEGYEARFQEIYMQAKSAYIYYEGIGPELQQSVPNADKLMELSWLWSAQDLAVKSSFTVYQINIYSLSESTILIWNGSSSKYSGMGFNGWHAVIVEEDTNGKLYVSQYITDSNAKNQYEAKTENGFVLLLFQQNEVVSVGDSVTVDFNYKNRQEYSTTGFGTVSFSSPVVQKPEKDNSNELTIVQGADTKNLIEVNLYDYGDNINTLYNSNHVYPGFQQDKGTTTLGANSNLKSVSFNFGNNITADLKAGNSSVTDQGGVINSKTNSANSPISGAIKSTLGSDGYPALTENGENLAYLFSDGTYATKKNTSSINGLFQYNPVSGEYTFNSRENHAQFNEGPDTFTLYQQILTPNFMMYPFGNFLPFNDIVHDSAQTSTIDRAYLEQIAESALYKNSNGAGSEYGTLGSQLNTFIGLMDDEKGTNWTAVDALNKYFSISNIPKHFDLNNTDDQEHLQNLYSLDYDEPTDFYFGMEMKMEFIQPKDGMTGKDTNHDGKSDYPMVFEFSGDDDVWVFIDGQLFLDLSGIHRHVGGKIDFTTGKIYYYSLDKTTGDVSTTPDDTSTTFSALGVAGLNDKGTFADYSKHTFNFYYMERGSGSGVCRMNFNFPLLQKNAIRVTKEVSVEGADIGLLGNPDFHFQVFENDGTTTKIGPGVTYDILNANGERIGTGTTGEKGMFSIKANQTAVFQLEESAGEYIVQELLEKSFIEQYGTLKIDGEAKTLQGDVLIEADEFYGIKSPVKDISEGSTAFLFDNIVDVNKLGSLSITKTITRDGTAPQAGVFNFEVALEGTPLPVGTAYTVAGETRYVAAEGIIPLAEGETAVIANILAGSRFSVQETADSAAGYTVSYTVDGSPVDSASGIIGVGRQTAVICDNSEYAASVELPFRKTLLMSDGVEHTYRLKLEQVTDQSGATAVDPGLSQELPIKITNTEVTNAFTIHYTKAELETLTFPHVYYYKITELNNSAEETDTLFDTAAYVAEVTITKADGAYTAAVTNVWKDGTAVTSTADTPAIAFTNTIQRYELPQTGGRGTIPVTTVGLLLTAAALMLLYVHSRRKKGVSRVNLMRRLQQITGQRMNARTEYTV